MTVFLAAFVFLMAAGGAAYVFAGANGARSQKRIDAVVKPQDAARAGRSQSDVLQQRRKNVQLQLKELEKQKNQKKERITTRRRLDQAGLPQVSPRAFWIASAGLALGMALVLLLMGQSWIVILFASFATGIGLPRWILSFRKARRLKAFTKEFANAIDVIVRSVKSGLPVNEALRIVARESPEPVKGEFYRLCEGLKVGVTVEQGLQKMHDSMPTTEVNFFGIVMTIQQKSGGNLSEALGNLSGVLRDRKRLEGKIKAMSSEAKASAMIIGSLPPGVMGIVYLTTPGYISLLFTERLGNLMLLGCAFWMSTGIAVMRKMINFKH